jgi:hypothetical protein
MLKQELIGTILQAKKTKEDNKTCNQEATYEVAQLLSGSFVFPLYGLLWQEFYDMEAISEHLEDLFDRENHTAFIYFIFMLADAVDYVLPELYIEMSASEKYIPIISSAIISDWLDYHTNSEIEIIEVD